MIFLPIYTKTRDNERCHWRQKAKRTKLEREAAFWAVKASVMPLFPVCVTITRCGPRKLDAVNLGSAMKAVIDGIADAYGVDDGDERWRWVFAQRKQSLYGVEIVIEVI